MSLINKNRAVSSESFEEDLRFHISKVPGTKKNFCLEA